MKPLMAALLVIASVLAAVAVASGVLLSAAQAPAQSPSAQPDAAAVIQAAIDTEGLPAARRKMDEMHAHPEAYSFKESDINALGYRYLSRRSGEAAIAVFEFNVKRFPASDNVYDSLTEACINTGDFARAETTLNAWRAKSAKEGRTPAAIDAFRAQLPRRREELRHSYEPGQPTGVRGPYFGQKPPGITPQVFAPGIISMVTTPEYACTMSPDGTEFYFTRSSTDRTQPQVIMFTRLVEGGWTFPQSVAFSAGFSAHEPHVSRDNTRIYWGWFRPIPAGEPNLQKMDYGIWASDRTSTGWSTASYVGQGMFVSTANDGSVYVTDHTELPNGYLARARMVNGRFAGLERLKGGMEKMPPMGRPGFEKVRNIAHPAIAPDGSFVVFDSGGGFHLWVCFRNADGTWSEGVDLTEHGIDPMAGIAFVSPDGKYLFFGLRGDVYWVSTELIEGLRPGVAAR